MSKLGATDAVRFTHRILPCCTGTGSRPAAKRCAAVSALVVWATRARRVRCCRRLAERGDRIVVAKTARLYRESLTLQAARHSGIPTRPFVIVGNGATIDGSAPVPGDAWEHVEGEVFRFRPRSATFQILFLGGKPAAALRG